MENGVKNFSTTNFAIKKNTEHLINEVCTPVVDVTVGVSLDHYISLRIQLIMYRKSSSIQQWEKEWSPKN